MNNEDYRGLEKVKKDLKIDLEALKKAIEESSVSRAKEVELYSNRVSAWFDTALEHDKIIVMLSTGAVGFLITLLTTIGAPSIIILWLYFFSIFFFAVAILATLHIFKRNSVHPGEIIHSRDTEKNLSTLKELDRVVNLSFGFGIALSIIGGGSTALHSHFEKKKSMSNETKQSGNSISVMRESVAGAGALRPQAQHSIPPPPAPSGTAPATNILRQVRADSSSKVVTATNNF